MSDTSNPEPAYDRDERVVFQQTPAHHVDEGELDSDGMLRESGVIDKTPDHEGTFAGKKVQYEERYKIEQEPGVYSYVPEEQILGYVGQVPLDE